MTHDTVHLRLTLGSVERQRGPWRDVAESCGTIVPRRNDVGGALHAIRSRCRMLDRRDVADGGADERDGDEKEALAHDPGGARGIPAAGTSLVQQAEEVEGGSLDGPSQMRHGEHDLV